MEKQVKTTYGAGAMARWLRACIALAKKGHDFDSQHPYWAAHNHL